MSDRIIKVGGSYFFRDHRNPSYTQRGTVEAIGAADVLKFPYRVRLENGKVAWAAAAELIPIGPTR
jgi:hypothetical protein